MSANLGQSCLATQISAPGPVVLGGSATVEAGRSDADSAARPVAEEGAGGGAQERPASQTEVETLVLEPPRAGVEGVAEGESAPRAPVAEETRVSVPAEA